MTATKSKRGCFGSLLRVLGLGLVLGLLLAAGALLWARNRVYAPYQGYPGAEVVVDIPAGAGVNSILGRLEQAGVIRDARLSGLWLVHLRGNPPLRAGEYRFSGAAGAPAVLEKLIHGDVVTHSVTLVEGLSLDEIVAHLAETGFGQADALRKAALDPSPMRDLDPKAKDLEGYLFPDTYAFARHTSEAEIVATLVRTFRARALPALKPFTGDGRSLREIVTLASIVEKEAKQETERPLIAGVYANRLRIGMGLYADPTVIYALRRRGGYDGNIHKGDLQIDDPYNTYRYPGLPPGPICSPGLASLEAAAHPASAGYLYFVSKNDGTHAFATTLAEHNRNVEVYQKRYWRERWANQGHP